MKMRSLLTLAICLFSMFALERVAVRPLFAQVRAALVQNIDEPGRNALAFSGQTTRTPTYIYTVTVPLGQRFVVRSYSATCAVPGSLTDVTLQGTTSGVQALLSTTAHQVRPSDIRVGDRGATIYQGTGEGFLVADPGSTLTLTVSDGGRDSGYGPCTFYISGYTIANS